MIYSCAPPPPRGCGVESHATTALLPKYGAGHTGNGAPKAGQCPTKAAYQMERKTPARSGELVCMTTLCKTSITGRIFRSTVSKLSTRDVTDTDTRTHQTLFRRQQAREREREWEQTEIYWTPEITATGYEVSFSPAGPTDRGRICATFFLHPR